MADVQHEIKGYRDQIDEFLKHGDMADAGDLLYNMTNNIRRNSTLKNAVISTGSIQTKAEEISKADIDQVFKDAYFNVTEGQMIEDYQNNQDENKGPMQLADLRTSFPKYMDINVELLKHLKTINPNITGEMVSEMIMNPKGDFDILAAKYGFSSDGIKDMREGYSTKNITYDGLLKEAIRYANDNTKIGQYLNSISEAMTLLATSKDSDAQPITKESIIKSYLGDADDLWSSTQRIDQREDMNMNSILLSFAKADMDTNGGDGSGVSREGIPIVTQQTIAGPRDDYEAKAQMQKQYGSIAKKVLDAHDKKEISNEAVGAIHSILGASSNSMASVYNNRIDLLEHVNPILLNDIETYIGNATVYGKVEASALGSGLVSMLDTDITSIPERDYEYGTRREILNVLESGIINYLRNTNANFDELGAEDRDILISNEFREIKKVFSEASTYIGGDKRTQATYVSSKGNLRINSIDQLSQDIIDYEDNPEFLSKYDLSKYGIEAMSFFTDKDYNPIPIEDREKLDQVISNYGDRRSNFSAEYEKILKQDEVNEAYQYSDQTYREGKQGIIYNNVLNIKDEKGSTFVGTGAIKETQIYDKKGNIVKNKDIHRPNDKNDIESVGITNINGQYFDVFRISKGTGESKEAGEMYFMPIDNNFEYANIDFAKGEVGDKFKKRYLRDYLGGGHSKNSTVSLELVGLDGEVQSVYNPGTNRWNYKVVSYAEDASQTRVFSSMNNVVSFLMRQE